MQERIPACIAGVGFPLPTQRCCEAFTVRHDRPQSKSCTLEKMEMNDGRSHKSRGPNGVACEFGRGWPLHERACSGCCCPSGETSFDLYHATWKITHDTRDSLGASSILTVAFRLDGKCVIRECEIPLWFREEVGLVRAEGDPCSWSQLRGQPALMK